MNIEALASDIARRIPEMAQDNPINNANVIERMIREAIKVELPDSSIRFNGDVIEAGTIDFEGEGLSGVVISCSPDVLRKIPVNILYRSVMIYPLASYPVAT